ncbi:MAG: sulfate adenylyltransferase subunit CysD [Actinobacteria bacterium]|nr:sulfate adenylyltransferase subunit CysD [Actinomycetota bacterium]MCB9411617.1 sulfate adenylyltransferase subunit CysD [Actinomycetota bacterium]
MSTTHAQIVEGRALADLEAEAIWVMRETAAAFARPVLLYSIGKDSTVLLHLARKAFHPGPIPFPVMHIDTGWKFREMIAFRDATAARLGLDLRIATNQRGRDEGVTPFTHGTQEYTRIMKTVALREGLDAGGFDVAIGGSRRDEEKSRAKERIFSLRESGHRWEPRKQRPEFWHTVNSSLVGGQTMRAFPISNWTELDVWRYVAAEELDVVPLYFSAPRPVVEREGVLVMVDDDRLPLAPGEVPEIREVRFRTLGCYPLTGGVTSPAYTVDELIAELQVNNMSERSGRLIDGEGSGSMERKKVEGYF